MDLMKNEVERTLIIAMSKAQKVLQELPGMHAIRKEVEEKAREISTEFEELNKRLKEYDNSEKVIGMGLIVEGGF